MPATSTPLAEAAFCGGSWYFLTVDHRWTVSPESPRDGCWNPLLLPFGAVCALVSPHMRAIPWSSAVPVVCALVLTGSGGCGNSAPSIDTLALPGARVGLAYDTRFEASGAEDLVWRLADGGLPPGLALSRDGRIQGIAEAQGRFELSVEVTASSGGTDRKRFVLQVGEGRPLTLHTTRLTEAVVDVGYNARLAASGGVAPYRWRVTAGALPEGITLVVEDNTARLTGTTTAIGSFDFALELLDDRGASIAHQMTLTVSQQQVPLQLVTDEVLPPAHRDQPYEIRIQVEGGGTEARQWGISEGNLAPGLEIVEQDRSSIFLKGSPSVAGRFAFTLNVSEIGVESASKYFVLVVGADPIQLEMKSLLQLAKVGETYTASIAYKGGMGNGVRYALSSGRLPRGLFLVDGQISGVAQEAGVFPLGLSVSDDTGTSSGSVTLEVLDDLRLSDNQTLSDAYVSVQYEEHVSIFGAAFGASRFDHRGVPPGLNVRLEDNQLWIYGIPRVSGVYSATISVTDAQLRQASGNYDIIVYPELKITTENLPVLRTGIPYSALLTVEGGHSEVFKWKIVQGRLPTGIVFDTNSGRLSGTSTVAGQYELTFAAIGVQTSTTTLVLRAEPTSAP